MARSSAPDSSRFRGRRIVAVAGVLTSLVALASLALGAHRQPLVSLWLLVAGLALAALSLHAMRGERAALVLLDERRAERDVAESARRAAETRSRELANCSPDLLTLHEPDGRLRDVSSACREMLGYEPEELIGRLPDDLIHPDDQPTVVAIRNRARTAGDAAAVLRVRRRDERYVWVEASCRWSATRTPERCARPTRSCATCTIGSRPSRRWPWPRSASAPPSRRAPSGWPSPARTDASCA